MAKDTMTLTILDDGTARIEVDGISGPNHVAADALVKFFAGYMGGPLQIHKAPGLLDQSFRDRVCLRPG